MIILLAGVAGAYMGYSNYGQTVMVAGLFGVVLGLVIVATAKQRIKGKVGEIEVKAKGP